MLGLFSSSKLDWGSYIILVAKTASKKIAALICSKNFLFPEVTLYVYKSTIWSCMEYCCHVWAGAPSCDMERLDKLQKQTCRTVGPSPAASLEHLTQCWSLCMIIRYYFSRCSSQLAQMVPLPYSLGRCTCYSDRLCNFLSPFLDVTYLHKWLWNFLPLECFPLSYDLNAFQPRIKRHLLSVGSF